MTLDLAAIRARCEAAIAEGGALLMNGERYQCVQWTNDGAITVAKLLHEDVPALLAEVLSFANGARMIEPVPVFKGHIRDTDWFGPLEPCRPDSNHPQGGFQKHIVDLFATVTGRVEFAGVAEDFCEHNMRLQTMRYFEGTDFFKKMAFMSDGTAAIVPNAPHVLELRKRADAKGIVSFTHDQPLAA